MSFVKLMNFKPQTASKNPLRVPSLSTSHLMKFAYVSYNKSLRKELNHPRRQPAKKA